MCIEWGFFGGPLFRGVSKIGALTFIALLLATLSTLLLNMENGAKRNDFAESRFTRCARKLSEVWTESYEPIRRTNLNEIKKRKTSSPDTIDLPSSCNDSDIYKILTEEELTEEIISFGIFLTNRQAYTAHSHLINILKKSYYDMMHNLWKNFRQLASKHQLPDKLQKKLWTECAIAHTQELNRLQENSKEDISSFLKRPIIFFIQFENFLGDCTKMWYDSIDQNRKKWEHVLSQRIASYCSSG